MNLAARLRRFGPLLLVGALLATIWASGLADRLSWANIGHEQAALAAWVSDHRIIAPSLFVIGYAFSTALSLPQAALLTLVGGLLFGAVAGAGLAATGATIGASILFVMARSALGDTVARRGGPTLAKLREALARDGFGYLLAIRLVPIVPFWLINLAAPLSGMRLPVYMAATALGIFPSTFILASIGAGLGGVLAAGGKPDVSVLFTVRILGPLIGLAVLVLATIAWKRWRRRDG